MCPTKICASCTLAVFEDGIIILCQHNIIIPSSNTARVQEAHILVGHIFCQIIEEQLFD